MLKETARHYYLDKGCNCAVSMFKAINDEYHLNISDDATALIQGFGGGMWSQSVCGAITGCIAALGKMYEMPELKEKCNAFVTAFEKQEGTLLCSDLGAKYKTEETRCVKTVEIAADLFEQLFNK